jgi:hypothetical protein
MLKSISEHLSVIGAAAGLLASVGVTQYGQRQPRCQANPAILSLSIQWSVHLMRVKLLENVMGSRAAHAQLGNSFMGWWRTSAMQPLCFVL